MFLEREIKDRIDSRHVKEPISFCGKDFAFVAGPGSGS